MLSTKEIKEYVHVSESMTDKKQYSHNEGTLIGDTPGISWDKFGVEQSGTGLNIEHGHVKRDPAMDVAHDELMVTGKIASVHLDDAPDDDARLGVTKQEAERATRTPGREGA